MHKHHHFFSTFILLFFLSSFSWTNEYPDFEPLFSIKDYCNIREETSTFSADQVFQASLLFSECKPDSDQWKNSMNAFKKIKDEVTSKKMQELSEADRGREILKYLYRDYLKKYDYNQTKLDVAIENGSYNCVSSAILYLAAAKAAGLQVYGQQTSQHAFCSVYLPSEKSTKRQKIDVETTNPYGFNPGSKEEIENESKIKQYYVVPKKYYSNRQQVSDSVFTGLIAGNLCSEYIKLGDYYKAIPLGAARFEAVRTENSSGSTFVRNNFDILACNYINILPKTAGEYAPMLEWFTRFIKRWGNNDFIQKNIDNGFYNLLVLCFNEKNYTTASESYKIINPYLTKKQNTKSLETLSDILILSKTEGQNPYEQINTITEIKNTQNFTNEQKKRADLYLEKAWLEILNTYMRKHEYKTGYEVSLNAIKQLPQSTNIQKMKQGFFSNCITQIHNNFAKEANLKNFEEALKILENGLSEFPDNKTLLKDLSDLKKVMDN